MDEDVVNVRARKRRSPIVVTTNRKYPGQSSDRKRVLLNGHRGDYTLIQARSATRAAGSSAVLHRLFYKNVEIQERKEKRLRARARRISAGSVD